MTTETASPPRIPLHVLAWAHCPPFTPVHVSALAAEGAQYVKPGSDLAAYYEHGLHVGTDKQAADIARWAQ